MWMGGRQIRSWREDKNVIQPESTTLNNRFHLKGVTDNAAVVCLPVREQAPHRRADMKRNNFTLKNIPGKQPSLQNGNIRTGSPSINQNREWKQA